MPEYRLAASAEAERLEAQAAAATEEAKEDIQRADNYVLAAVLFAASLFFGGLSLRMRTDTGRKVVLARDTSASRGPRSGSPHLP